MKQKLFTLFLALAASVGTMNAYIYERVQIGKFYYNLDTEDYTAEVTNKSNSNWGYNITTADIPSTVIYNETTYNVTSIGQKAFYSCNGLTSAIIPGSITSIGYGAFESCSALISVTIEYGVTSIEGNAFQACSSLTTINMPGSLNNVGDLVFSGCTSLPVIDNCRYADTYLIGAIDKSLSSYSIKEGTVWIGAAAFYNCSALTSVTIPNSVIYIESSAFESCSSLTSITLPNNLQSIENQAFYECTSLNSINIPNSVTFIGSNAFYRCYSIPSSLYNSHVFGYFRPVSESEYYSYTIPNGIETIAGAAFRGCSLTSVTIPSSVTNIDGYAFRDCTSLTSVTCLATIPPFMGKNVFRNVDCSTITLYVPAESVTAYQTADQWKDFYPIVGIDVQALDQISQEPKANSQKLIKNGQVFIIRGDKTYTLTGQEVK